MQIERNRNEKETKKKKQSQQKGKGNSNIKNLDKVMTIQCNICKQTFMNNSNQKSLAEHADNRHQKNTFKECFPMVETEEEEKD